MLPFDVVQSWTWPVKLAAAVVAFAIGFVAFIVIVPGDDGSVVTSDGRAALTAADGEPTPLVDDGGATAPDAGLPTSGEQATVEGASSAGPDGIPSTGEGDATGGDEQAPSADGPAGDAPAADDDGASTTPADPAPSVDPGSSLSVFEPIRNTRPEFTRYADVPSEQLDIGALTEVAERPDNGSVGDGQFRLACEYSHFAYDDPIVFPGEPGRRISTCSSATPRPMPIRRPSRWSTPAAARATGSS